MAYALLEQVLMEKKKPMVIDADGLNILAESKELQDLLKERGRENKKYRTYPSSGGIFQALWMPGRGSKKGYPAKTEGAGRNVWLCNGL